MSMLSHEAGEQGEHTLKRSLGAVNLVTLGIGAVIGAGIFVLTGQAAALYAGPAVALSFVLAGITCAFAGLCYAEFASIIPIAGSAYTYGYATLGELVAWIIGWDLVLEYAFGASTVASGWSGYFNSLLQQFGIYIPPQLTASTGTHLVLLPPSVDADDVAAAGRERCGLAPRDRCTQSDCHGDRHGDHVHPCHRHQGIGELQLGDRVHQAQRWWRSSWSSAAISSSAILKWPGRTGILSFRRQTRHGNFGWTGIPKGASRIFFAYIGFDAVSTAAQEAKKPQRDMPIGILGSLVICTILYILVSLVLTGLVSYKTLNVGAPVAIGIDATGVSWGSMLVKIGAVFGLASVMLVMLLGQTRVFYSMSKDGLLWKWVSTVHPKFRTPWITTIVFGIFAAMFPAFLPIDRLADLVNIGTLLAFTIVSAGVWVLRVRHPELKRPFKTPLVPLVPILGILSALYLMANLALITWEVMIGWLLLGLLIYFTYSVKHSKVQKLAKVAAAD